MAITTSSFGSSSSGQPAVLYTITNENGYILEVTDFGARWVSMKVPSQNGLIDVTAGYPDVTGYEKDTAHLGSVVGRHANRLSNAAFTLDGITYHMPVTDPENNYNLHSGPDFFSNRFYKAEILEQANAVRFTLQSPHMDQGLPGNLTFQVTYQLTKDNAVKLLYDAVSDQKTVLNMTNHSYFNLNGHNNGTIWKHSLWIDSSHMTEVQNLVSTGAILETAGTIYDYTTARPVERELDNNWCQEPHHTLEKARMICIGDQSGIQMQVHTDLPGIQVYTGNFLDETGGKENACYSKGSAMCFESQYYVNAMNIENPAFKKPVLEADIPFHSETWYVFC